MRKNPNQPLRRIPFAVSGEASMEPRSGRTTTSQTPLHIHSPGVPLDPTAMDYVRQRLGFKLGKFALRIRDIELHLKDENGPKGTPTVGCSILVHLDAVGDILVEHRSSATRAAFDITLDRAERAVRRALQKHRDLRPHGSAAMFKA